MTTPSKRILIVEDQRLIAADLASTLKRLGYDVAGSVASGEEAVPAALELHPDLILMDIRLRDEMDGIQAAEAIRARSDVPIVYLTAYADEETIARAKGTTPFGYLVKPFNERELRAAIEIAIYKHDADRLLAEERAGRRAAEEFKLLVDSVKDYAIYMLDPSGHVATWNEGARRIKGYAAGEILGKHLSVFYPPEDVEAGRPREVLQRALRDGRAEIEGFRVRKDGSRFWASTVITPMTDGAGRLHGFGHVTRDLTDRKRREEDSHLLDCATLALASSLDLSTTLPEVVRIVIPVVADGCLLDLADDAGQLVPTAIAHSDPECEAVARRLSATLPPQLGLDRGPRHVFATGISEIHPNGRDAAPAAEPLPATHPELLRRLGARSYVSLPVRCRGRTLGVLTFLRSAPFVRYAKSDLPFFEELSRRIGLAIDNARLYRQAQEAIVARDEFLQIASHELNTPLTPLRLQLDAVTRALSAAGVRNDRLSQKVAAATRQTMRLAVLVDTLLDVSRLSAGQIVLDREVFDLAAVVRDLAARFRVEAAKVGSELAAHVEGSIVGRWDRARVEQILSNLLSNAVKFGAGRPIEIRATVTGGVVRISIADHGIGIGEDAMRRIFGRFERAASLRHYGGFGLGLFMARQLAEAHGGTIVAESQPGVGSRFTVALPLEPTPLDQPRVA
ncbi:MAG: response regulator [Deltaproteobacteria bacterium]|nr:response regulator [Deltaproteobacteria bacterium]